MRALPYSCHMGHIPSLSASKGIGDAVETIPKSMDQKANVVVDCKLIHLLITPGSQGCADLPVVKLGIFISLLSCIQSTPKP